jgi:hypothetical protein
MVVAHRNAGTICVSHSLPYSDAHRLYLSQSYFPLLDGLRFISITAVIWHHTAGNIYAGILWRGSEGVSFFSSSAAS